MLPSVRLEKPATARTVGRISHLPPKWLHTRCSTPFPLPYWELSSLTDAVLMQKMAESKSRARPDWPRVDDAAIIVVHRNCEPDALHAHMHGGRGLESQ